ncbi:MAG: type II toxin-antitoxin system prevent-host-death family antitoxin [Micrococcales bacterium]|nr:type II toxin-antitoxin system prevent-host-death family antitoxin [Micrococcales bacterium]
MTPTTIAQRDLRNRSGEILRLARAGQTFIVTTNGEKVAQVVPLDADAITRPATRRGGWSGLPRVTRATATMTVIDELRGDR